MKPSFQFHKGTIKTIDAYNRQRSLMNFNSIKVQLKLLRASRHASQRPQFQFHKGTIKTSGRCPCDRTQKDFNSIKVQLKLQ